MNNYILNCKSPLLATFHAACCMLPGSSAASSFRLWRTNNPKCLWQYKVQGWFYFIFFFKRESQMDTTSVQAGHASSSYASEVYSSGAVERANEGIKKRI